MSTMEYENDQRGYDDEPAYPRERSRSPRADRDGDSRIRSASPGGRADRGPPPERAQDDGPPNEGSNLFVTGIHPRLSEDEVKRLFEKYGDVESCNIMRDPHTRESRGFGFVKMVTSDQAEAAKNGLQGEVYEGRTLSIERARRSRPRTPTPGKYFGPPKRDDRPPRRGYGDRYDDRRSYGGGGGRRDDYGGGYRGDRGGDRGGDRYSSRGGDRYDDRSYPRRDRDDRGGDRGGYSRDDRYGSRGGDDRRGGGGGGYGYDRPSRGAADAAPGYSEPAAGADPAAGGRRSYDDRGADRYERR